MTSKTVFVSAQRTANPAGHGCMMVGHQIQQTVLAMFLGFSYVQEQTTFLFQLLWENANCRLPLVRYVHALGQINHTT